MKKYNPKAIESKWQKKWEEQGSVKIDKDDITKEKYYVLDMFPYPSSNGLHMGHTENYTISDIVYRYKKMKGFNVLHPQGFDSFGLPAENYAIKTGVHPKETTKKNIENYIKQMQTLGLGYDFDEKIITSSPEYYKWTQWIFTKFFEAGLAYRKTDTINWCESCKTGLANEQVEGGKCERCKSEVAQKEVPGWFFKITNFADELIEGLEGLDWPEHTKKNQINWIGKSEGAEIEFKVKSEKLNNNNISNVVLTHGCPSDVEKAMNPETRTYDKHWFPWTKNELEKKGIRVDFPLMPNPWAPEYKEYKKVLDKLEINENSVLVGTSCGTSFLVRWLGDTKKKIKKLVLVAPWCIKSEDYGQQENELYNFDIDETIKNNIDEVIIFTSDNEKKEGKESAKIFKEKLNARVLEIKDYGHYLEKHMGTVEFPELIDEILRNSTTSIDVFTTRPDTLFGATYCVLAPEHELVGGLSGQIENWDEVQKYVKNTKKKTELERLEAKEKTGVELKGVKAINPANNEEVPIFIADYVLAHYGTGAIMAVPAHDERDFEFAEKFGLEIKEVISKKYIGQGENKERNGVETLNRKIVDAIIRDKEKNFYLIKEKGNHVHFVGGDIDEGENEIEALKREVIEETGFTDFCIKKKINPPITYWGYRHTKNKNQRTIGPIYEVVLNSNKRINSELEEGRHKLLKFKEEEVLNVISWEHHKYLFERYLQSSFVYSRNGVLVNSDKFDGMESEEAKKAITEFVGGKITSKYRLRDWSVSRQRYWGAPIPIVYDPEGVARAIPEEHLPWTLPEDVDFMPTGASPLANSKELKDKTEKIFGKGWTPDVDTLDTFVDSSWYFLRYSDVSNEKEFCNKERLKHWLPVDLYIGGQEHTYMHLLYARFVVRAMKKLGLIDFSEPFIKLRHQGMVLDCDGVKMSKSKGNVINPDDMTERFGADAVRMYMMFAGPLGEDVMWNENGVVGTYRFLEKVCRYVELWNKNKKDDNGETADGCIYEISYNKMIKKVSEDIENLKFNTSISSMMIFMNNIRKEGEEAPGIWGFSQSSISKNQMEGFLKLLAPFAPHITEELWSELGNSDSIHSEQWPEYNKDKIKEENMIIVVQVNGKVRGEFEAEIGASEEEIKNIAQQQENVSKWISGKDIKKIIYIKNKLVNIVI